jgi:hypothetical protein
VVASPEEVGIMSEVETPGPQIPPEALLGFFIHEYPDYVEEVPTVVFGSTRPSPKGKGHGYQTKPATITMAVPDEVVVNMRGEEDQRHWYTLMRVSREGLDKLQEDQNSRIVKPTDSIVKP